MTETQLITLIIAILGLLHGPIVTNFLRNLGKPKGTR